MTLWGCLLFPSLPLDVFARALAPHDAAQPFAVASDGHPPRVVVANAAARDAGIRDGQLVSGALALTPSLVLRDRDVGAEARALAQIATWTLTFTPTACLAPPHAVLADIDGSLRLFGGLPRLVTRLTAGAQELGYASRLAIAPTPGAALLLARAAHRPAVRNATELPAVLDPLPLALLDLPDATRETLRNAGIATFGQLSALPRDGVARRFGGDLVARIDRILGRVPDPRVPFVPPPRFSGCLELPAPAQDVEALGFGVQRLVRDLADWLLARGLGVTHLTLALTHERYLRARGVPPTVVPFALGTPARSMPHLLGVLRERLVRVMLPAPVEAIALESGAASPLAGRNLGLLPGDDSSEVDVPLVDRLRARLGDGAIRRLVPHAEHRPEHAMQVVTGGTALPAARASLPEALRPLWLLAEPQPLDDLLGRAPWILRDGPERIESGWWDGGDIRRDYFVADTADGKATVWIYRDCRRGLDSDDWFLHGIFA